MATASTTTLAEALQTHFQPAMIKTFSEITPIMDFIGTTPAKSGKAIEWQVNTSGNDSAETYSEGDAAPTGGSQAYYSPSVSFNHFQAVAHISGHANDAMKGGYFDGAIKEVQGTVSALAHLAEETIMADIVAAIAIDANYGGIDRTTLVMDAFNVAAGSVALSIEDMEDCWEAMHIEPRICDMSDWFWFCAAEQDMAYQRAADGLGGINISMNIGDVMDVGRAQSTRAFNGRPIVVFPTLTNTLMYGSKKSDLLIEELRPLKITPMGVTEDADKFLITWAGKAVHLHPGRATYISGLAT